MRQENFFTLKEELLLHRRFKKCYDTVVLYLEKERNSYVDKDKPDIFYIHLARQGCIDAYKEMAALHSVSQDTLKDMIDRRDIRKKMKEKFTEKGEKSFLQRQNYYTRYLAACDNYNQLIAASETFVDLYKNKTDH
jgi:hypothetical protein